MAAEQVGEISQINVLSRALIGADLLDTPFN
jgi:hypothetical protein